MKKIVLFLTFTALWLGCDSNDYLYDESFATNQQGWNHADSLNYDFEIKDTSHLYSLLMDISHSTDYPYQNLYLKISTKFPSGKELSQVLSSDLADKGGKWYGDCASNACTAHINLQKKALFTEPGQHSISISQFSRDSALLGIKEVRLKLMKFEG